MGGVVEAWIEHDSTTGVIDVDTNHSGAWVGTYDYVLKTTFGHYEAEKYINVSVYE
jgi:hypothetical protein